MYEDIVAGNDGEWEKCLPEELVSLIKKNKSFGYGREEDPFEYDKSDGQDAEYY